MKTRVWYVLKSRFFRNTAVNLRGISHVSYYSQKVTGGIEKGWF